MRTPNLYDGMIIPCSINSPSFSYTRDPWCMDHRFHIIPENDVVCAWEMSYSFKSVWVCFDEIFFGIELLKIGEVFLYLLAFCCGFLLCELSLTKVYCAAEFHNS